MPKLRKEEKTNPLLQKLALFFFGLGPLFLMGWFLVANGFFESP